MSPQNDMRPKMLVIDGTSLLATCYYANLPMEIKTAKTEEEKEALYGNLLHSNDGVYTNGILGFCKTLVRFIKEWEPAYVVVAFDKSRSTTFRRRMYADYKGQRGSTPKPLKEQIILMEQILSSCRIPVFISENFEADDLAGSVTEKYKETMQIILVTKDRDYLQLVDDEHNVRCMILTEPDKAEEFRESYGIPQPSLYCFRNLMEFNAARVESEKGVKPEFIPDLKGIEGDASDNIPGVRGVSSAAAPLVSHYGGVENLYAAIRNLNKKEQKEVSGMWKEDLGINRSPMNMLLKGEREAYLSTELATIQKDIPLPDITPFPASRINRQVFNGWMQKLDITTVAM